MKDLNSTKRHKVLAIDDTPSNLELLKGVLVPEYRLLVAKSGELGISIVRKQMPELILLDVMMPGMSGYEVCMQLKADPETTNIPIIFLTAMTQEDDEKYGFSLGAVDYITKPFRPPVLLARIKTHLALADQQKTIENEVKRKTIQLMESQRDAIYMLGEAGHYNDTDTGVHIWRMASYAGELAKAALWSCDKAQLLELAAPMHDTGKIGIPDEILKAPRRLTPEEFEIIKTHTTIGYRILKRSNTELFKLAAEVALYHHEKWDGGGYPNGLKGEKIPQSARIVAIADVFDALTMVRPYKKSWTVDSAYQLLQENSGTHFDPELVELFLAIRPKIEELMQVWALREKDENADLFLND